MNLIMEAVNTSEKSVNFYTITGAIPQHIYMEEQRGEDV
jgi:hypothetical protein